MHIMVNGDQRDVADPLTVEQLLKTLHIDPRLVVVERNREILKREHLTTTHVATDDHYEIVRIVGGGS